jgi:cupin fold WbuC family metalloprotein
MMKIYSKTNTDRLLHIVYYKESMINERQEIVEPNNFIQVCALNMKKGKTFRPHQHIWKDGPDRVIAQESWCVISGLVDVSFFDIDGKFLAKVRLYPGDISVTLEGGHTYECIEESIVYEYKTGPYTGVENDKVFLDG